MIKQILLASDGSSHAERATQEAIRLAGIHQGKVTILYAMDPSKSNENGGNLGDQVTQTQQKLGRTESSLTSANIPYSLEVLEGEPGPAIVTYANNNPCDVIVIGSRGLNGLQEMVLGSVSHKVAKRSKCPVLVVK